MHRFYRIRGAERAAAGISADFSPKHLGSGQFYLMTIADKDGKPFDGGRTYCLNVPPDPPVKLYWSATAYDRATHALIREMPSAACSSVTPGLTKNADGSRSASTGGRLSGVHQWPVLGEHRGQTSPSEPPLPADLHATRGSVFYSTPRSPTRNLQATSRS